jgi:very-short-patch-repair endonuclease
MTPSERLLWEWLRGGKLGARFRRQQVISGYVADFYSERLRLAVEVDGPIHECPERQRADEERDRAFAARGVRTLRFTNDEVECGVEHVVRRIQALLPSPSPCGRGGQRG